MRTSTVRTAKICGLDYVLMLALGVLGALVVVIITHRDGPGISPDSVAYISAARSFARGHGMYQYDGTPLLLWPPGLPFALGVLMRLSLGFRAAAVLLNSVCFSGYLVLTYVLMRRVTGSQAVAWLGAACLLGAYPVVKTCSYVWSDGPFLFLVLLSLTMVLRLAERPSWRLALGLGLVLAAACMTRYIGIAVVVAAVVSVVWLCRCALVQRITMVCAVAAPPAAAVIAWLLRNRAVSGTLTGSREQTIYAPSEVCLRTLQTVGRWVVPERSGPSLCIAATALVLAAVVLLPLVYRRNGGGGAGFAVAVVTTVFVLVYLVAYGASASTTLSDIDDRTMSPLLAPLWVSLTLAAWRVVGHVRVGRRALAVVMLAVAAVPATRTGAYARGCVRGAGAGEYAAPSIRRSSTLSVARVLDWHMATVSNMPELMYLYTGRVPMVLPRRVVFYGSDRPVPGDLQDFLGMLAKTRRVRVIWFRGHRGFRYTPAELESYVTVVSRTTYPDGVIEVIAPRRPAASAPGCVGATGSASGHAGGRQARAAMKRRARRRAAQHAGMRGTR